MLSLWPGSSGIYGSSESLIELFVLRGLQFSVFNLVIRYPILYYNSKMEESYFLEGEYRLATPNNAEPFSIRWNGDDSLLAVGLGDGTCALYLDKAPTPVTTMDCRNGSDLKMPVTCMRWRP